MNDATQAQSNKPEFQWKDVLFSFLLVILVSIFPTVFLYSQNADEVLISEIVAPALYFCLTGIVVFALLYIVCRSANKAAISATVLMIIITNYAGVESAMQKVYSGLRYWHCVAILLFLVAHIVYLIARKLSAEGGRYVTRIATLVLSALVLMNVGGAVPTIINKISTDNKIAEQIKKQASMQTAQTNVNPNIYYIILDEYCGFETIKKAYGYDNEAFAKDLENLGFTVSRDSYNDEISTNIVTANLINLAYEATATSTIQELDALRKGGTLFKILTEQGYFIQGIGTGVDIYGLERVDGQDESTSTTMEGKSFSDLLYEKSAIYPFLQRRTDKQESTLISIDYLNDASNFPTNNMFTIAHLVFPHQPFLFDREGNPVGALHQNNWHDQQYYLNQYIYCTKCITKTITNIVKRDPSAIIILQSDHSARAATEKDLFMKMVPYEDMKNILNAVYYSGEAVDEISGQSGVNTLRLLMNRKFGYDFDVLEVPYGAYELYEKQVVW